MLSLIGNTVACCKSSIGKKELLVGGLAYYSQSLMLVTLELLIKETKTIKEGGYFHVYSGVDTATFEKRVREGVEEHEKNMSN